MTGRGLKRTVGRKAIRWVLAAASAGCLLLLVAPPCTASAPGDEPRTPPPRVRALDRCGARLLDEALTRSAILRALVARLDATDVVVYLTVSPPPASVSGMPRGKTRFMSATPANRFVQVWVDAAQAPDGRIAVLAHELQHALEVAADAGVRDVSSFRRLYEGLGTRGHTTGAPAGVRRFETAAAVAVETLVLRELGQRTRLGTPGAER